MGSPRDSRQTGVIAVALSGAALLSLAGGCTAVAAHDATDTSADATGVATNAGPDAPRTACSAPPLASTKTSERSACAFGPGAKVEATLGIDASARAAIPITHVVVVTQENRAFDHLYGRLPGVEGPPPSFTNPDAQGHAVLPSHAPSTCLPGDPPHQGASILACWDEGKLDGFVKNAASSQGDGHFVMTYYDGEDLPFYYWLASTYAIADHHFASTLAGTWANRDFLYTGTSDGVTDTESRTIPDVPSVFDRLDEAGVPWGVYTNDTPRQDCLGWSSTHRGVAKFPAFLSALADGTLPPVSFVDPGVGQDEHPPNDVQAGERWFASIYDTAVKSPLWQHLAIVLTYDEAGAIADHVPPPSGCAPSAAQAAFDRYGQRVPLLVVSPWARAGYKAHGVSDHTSILRLIELLHDLPALTARDANADALLDMFDFECPPRLAPPTAHPAPGVGGCK